MSPYVLLGVAVVFEVFADCMMKLSHGFTKKAPIIGIVIGYVIAFYLMSQTLAHLPLGFVYAVWTGLGIALTAVVGAAIAIIGGVLVLKLGV